MASILLYLIVFTVSARLISTSNSTNNTSRAAFVGLVLLIVFAAGRYHVGTDMTTYNYIFARYSKMSCFSFFRNIESEFLFRVIAKITFAIGGRVLTWASFAALTVIPVYLTLRDDYKELCLATSFFVFCVAYYTTSFNITKQFVAVAIVFWAIHFLFNNQFFPFLVSIVIAAGFHTSALLAISIWFLWDHKKNCAIKGKKRVLILIVISVVVFFSQSVIKYVTSHISYLSSFSSFSELDRRGLNRDFYVSLFECAFIFVLCSQQRKENEVLDFMFSLLLISTIIGFTGFVHPQIKRNAYYFSVPAHVIISGYLPYRFTENSRTISKLLICTYFAVLFVVTAFILGEGDLIPYRFDLFSKW